MHVHDLILSLLLLLLATHCQTFNPHVFSSKDPDQIFSYVNDPVELSPESQSRLTLALGLEVTAPTGFLYKPPTSGGANTVVGLATYSFFFQGFQRFVGSLRAANFTGNIILGVSHKISKAELDYLKANAVTIYTVNVTECDEKVFGPSALSSKGKKATVGGGLMRGRCAKGLENLKIEMGRFELARQWLSACSECTGWSLAMDTRDAFFQADPFASLGNAATAKVNLLFVEEIAPHTSPVKDPSRSFVAGNPRNEVHTVGCYGKASYDTYSKRPVLCSGTIIGSREGMERFLKVMVDEFLHQSRVKNKRCRSPFTTDQWTMNYLYYTGRFGEVDRTTTLPYGIGPVQTVGKACMTKDKRTGATDIVARNSEGFIVNRFEATDGSISVSRKGVNDGLRVAPVVHQYDRCGDWARDFLLSRPDLFRREAPRVDVNAG